jgi:hypothetical protein
VTLLNESYLVIDAPNRTGVFQFQSTQTFASTIEKTYLAGGRGQFVNEVNRLLRTPEGFEMDRTAVNRRTGRWIDGGAGEWGETLTFVTGIEDESIAWGDGSGGDGQANVTPTDASGADVKPLSRKQILDYWIANSKSDSFGQTRLHIGEWTDGSYGDSDGGAFEQPMPIAIRTFNGEKQEDETASFTGTLEYAQVAPASAFEEDAADWITDDLASLIPDYVPDE